MFDEEIIFPHLLSSSSLLLSSDDTETSAIEQTKISFYYPCLSCSLLDVLFELFQVLPQKVQASWTSSCGDLLHMTEKLSVVRKFSLALRAEDNPFLLLIASTSFCTHLLCILFSAKDHILKLFVVLNGKTDTKYAIQRVNSFCRLEELQYFSWNHNCLFKKST